MKLCKMPKVYKFLKNFLILPDFVVLLNKIRFNSDSIKVYSRTVFIEGCTYSELVKHEEFLRRKNRG